MLRPAMLVWVLARIIYYKNRRFSRKAVDVLFGKVWGGKVYGSQLCEMKNHPPVCTERIYTTIK